MGVCMSYAKIYVLEGAKFALVLKELTFLGECIFALHLSIVLSDANNWENNCRLLPAKHIWVHYSVLK
jgi:hypothetical protein